MADQKSLPSTVAELREQWAKARRAALETRRETSRDSAGTDLGSPRRLDGDAKAELARFEAEIAFAVYVEARESEAASSSERLAQTNTKLARVQAWLAGAITLATIAQAIFAGMKP